MSKQDDAVKIQIMDKEYLVTCSEEERAELVASAKHLSAKMAEIRNSGKVVGIDRIAVMAGLNLAHDAIKSGGLDGESSQSTANRISALNAQIEKTLAKHQDFTLN
jgi:cell division protein ZapA